MDSIQTDEDSSRNAGTLKVIRTNCNYLYIRNQIGNGMIAEAGRGLFQEGKVPSRRIGRDKNVLIECERFPRGIRLLHSVNGG